MTSVTLDISYGACNARCPWCLAKDFKYKQKFLGTNDIEKFIELNSEEKIDITISGFGEPLLNPYFFEIIRILIKQPNIMLSTLSTNLSTRLDINEIQFIVNSFKKISVDMGGLSIESRKNNMQIKDDYFPENLKMLSRADVEKKCIYKVLKTKNNINELKDFGEGFQVTDPIIFNPEYYYTTTNNYDYNNYLSNLFDITKTEFSKKKLSCNELTNLTDERKIRVLSNGDVILCCMIPYSKSAVVGNAFLSPLNQIFLSEGFKNALKLIEKREYCEEYCNACYEIKYKVKNV